MHYVTHNTKLLMPICLKPFLRRKVIVIQSEFKPKPITRLHAFSRASRRLVIASSFDWLIGLSASDPGV